MRSTIRASFSGRRCAYRATPIVPGSPLTSIESLTVIGRPSNGSRSPRARISSARIALCRASSSSSTTIALIVGLYRSMRHKYRSNNSRAETCFASKAFNRSVAEAKASISWPFPVSIRWSWVLIATPFFIRKKLTDKLSPGHYTMQCLLLSETNISILETTRSCRLVCHPARREESLCRARRASGAEILRGAQDDITLPVLVVQVHYHGFAIVYKETSFRTQPIRKEHHRSC